MLSIKFMQYEGVDKKMAVHKGHIMNKRKLKLWIAGITLLYSIMFMAYQFPSPWTATMWPVHFQESRAQFLGRSDFSSAASVPSVLIEGSQACLSLTC